MPHADSANPVLGDSNGSQPNASAADWITDPQRLNDWQMELVDNCRQINRQLSQIQDDLTVMATENDNSSRFRVVSPVPAH